MLKLTDTHPATADVDVRVIGVGGAGCSSLIRLQEYGSENLNLLGIDSGSAAHNLPSGVESITIGKGFGSGGNAETAEGLFPEAELAVADFVEEADVVIILAGLGRGTGSGLSPLIAKLSRDAGALTIAAVNMPFEFEGRFRNHCAEEAHSALKEASDAVITMNNDDLSKLVDTSDEWIKSRVGINQRHVVSDGEASSDMSTKVAHSLLEKRGISAANIDVIIIGTVTPDHPTPSTAAIVQNNINAENAWAFDLSAACSGFLYALETGAKFIESGQYKTIMVIGVDTMTSILDFEDREIPANFS